MAVAVGLCGPVVAPNLWRSGGNSSDGPDYGDRNQYHPVALCKHMQTVSTGKPPDGSPSSKEGIRNCRAHLEEMEKRHSKQGWRRIRQCLLDATTSAELLECQRGK